MKRREFLTAAALIGLSLTCRNSSTAPNNILWPAPIYDPPPPRYEQEIWIVDDFAGEQRGTRDNPFSAPAEGFDALMKTLTANQTPTRARFQGSWKTRAAYEWGPIESPWTLPSNWWLDGGGMSELELDVNVPDSYIQSVPLHLVRSADGYVSDWDKVQKNQRVTGWTFRANHTKLVDRWRASNAFLLPSAVILGGHSPVIEDIELEDFGAWGLEAFPLMLAGAISGIDRHNLSFLDPSTHIFDDSRAPAHISRVKFTKFDPSSSNAQVSIAVITGMFGAQTIPTDAWAELPPYTQLFRRSPYICDVEARVPGSPRANQVQLATIYQCTDGEIRRITGENVQCCVYGDYYITHNLRVNGVHGTNVLRGVTQFLSPTAANIDISLPATFSSDGLTIENALVRTDPINVTYHGGIVLDPLVQAWHDAGGVGGSRAIRNVTVRNSDVDSIKAVDVDGLRIENTIGKRTIIRGSMRD